MKYTLLSQGGYGNIYIDPTKTVICKRVPKYTPESHIVYSTILELIISSSVQTFSGVPYMRTVDVEKDHVAMYMSYHGNTLNKLINTGVCSETCLCDLSYSIMRSLVETLLQFKSANILHTDIKPCNILLSKSNPPKVTLIDFNCASVANVDYTSASAPHIMYTNAMATYNFAAPELVFDGQPNTKSCVWSLALIACMLFGGGYPIADAITHDKQHKWFNTEEDWKAILRSLQTGSPTMAIPSHILDNMSNDFKLTAWVSQAFSWEPANRPSLEDIYLSMHHTPLNHRVPIYENIATQHSLERHVRQSIIERYYSIAIDTNTKEWFTTAIFILDASGDSAYSAACWVIAGHLHNSYVLDDDTQVERLQYYFQEKPSIISEHVWKIGQNSNWKLWARPIDVVLLEDHGISLTFAELRDLMINIDRPWSPTAYAANFACANPIISAI